MRRLEFDYVVIGSGLAGSAAALLLSEHGQVGLVAKDVLSASNSYQAQGGIAAAVGPDDSPQAHAIDTLKAGNDLCKTDVVKELTERAPRLMSWLNSLGVQFDVTAKGSLKLGLEGAHSHHRILHAGGDSTGRVVMETLTEVVDQTQSIVRTEHTRVLKLLKNLHGQVIGASAQNQRGETCQLLGRRGTILATGGAGQLFLYTTNPLGATGDGLALAYQAGARLRNLEFVQFHPTALDFAANPRFLISEAVRGAGAHLVSRDGDYVMAHHEQGDLAPRDVVAREIYDYSKARGRVYLDARHILDFEKQFPTIYERCMEAGVDPLHALIPVTPAAHFIMGGVATDLSGKSSVDGLYAIGEVANSGIHGANRLASNSLLECLVMAERLTETVSTTRHAYDLQVVDEEFYFEEDDESVLRLVRQILWDAAGITRNERSAQHGLSLLHELRRRFPHSPALLVGFLIVESVLLRRESRGAHYRTDYPDPDPRQNFVDSQVSAQSQDVLLA